MKIQVRLFGTLGQGRPGHDPLQGMAVEIPQKSTVADLIARLQIEESKVGIVSVNRRLVDPRWVLEPEDEVRIFRPIFGG